jgi:uncharacterized protein YxjI
MGILRDRRERTAGTTYRMREKMFSIGDDYWIETEAGERAIKVDGKALRIRDTLVLEDLDGRELLRIQEKKLRVRDTMEIERDGADVATVKKALIGIRDRFSVTIEGGGELAVKGNFVQHEYEFKRDGETVAEVSKRWLRARDTYGISVAPGEDDVLIIAAAVCIERMSHD